MIGREKRVLLRHYLEQGMNKAVIARDLGVSRRTVYHWIETVGQALRTNRRAGLLEAAVGSVLHPADHEGPDAWPGVFVFLLRRRAP